MVSLFNVIVHCTCRPGHTFRMALVDGKVVIPNVFEETHHNTIFALKKSEVIEALNCLSEWMGRGGNISKVEVKKVY